MKSVPDDRSDHRPAHHHRRWAGASVTLLLTAGLVLGWALSHRPGPPQPAAGTTAAAQGVSPVKTGAPVVPTPTVPTPAVPTPAVPTPPSAPSTTKQEASPFGPLLSRSRPVQLDIPSIGVHSGTMVDLALNRDGTLQVPTDFDLPGWYSPGPAPGQFGPAVIAGHVDDKSGPAVFYRLGALRRGEKVTVGRADGTTARFTIDRVARYPKDQFPTAQVYGNTTNRAELRLITCGGTFDHTTGHYLDNVVAYAHLTS